MVLLVVNGCGGARWLVHGQAALVRGRLALVRQNTAVRQRLNRTTAVVMRSIERFYLLFRRGRKMKLRIKLEMLYISFRTYLIVKWDFLIVNLAYIEWRKKEIH